MKSLFASALILFGSSMLACAQVNTPAPLIENPTGHGTQFGTKPTQGLSFYGNNPIIQVQLGSGNELIAALKAYGLLGGSGAINLNLNGGSISGASLSGTVSGLILSSTAISGSATLPQFISGTVSPVGSLAAPPGTYDFVILGGTGGRIYYKASGTSTSGWLTLTGT